MTHSDLQLLARYRESHAEDAFAELARRHLPLVYSAALRQVRSPQLAEEVAQSAFTDLARNAHRLAPDTILTAWLYQVTRRTAIDVVRRESRRQLREQIATELNAMNTATADWTDIEPLLDEAVSALDETDRAAVLLRYFENKSLRDVGRQLGVSDDTAQKRVSRAVERLRAFLAKRGVAVGASGLVAVVSANAVHAAPAGLAITISAATAIAGTTITATTQAIAMTTLQKTLVTATVAILAGAGIHEARQASQLRDQVQILQGQHAPLAGRIQELQQERDDALAQLAALRSENERLSRNAADLPKLRGEVTRLRETLRDERVSDQAKPPARASIPDEPNDPLEQEKRAVQGRTTDARAYIMHFIRFASENQGYSPTHFPDSQSYNVDYPVSQTNSFEIVHKQPINISKLGANAGRTALVREYLAWRTSDGKWAKTYGFADAHSEIIVLEDGAFTEWEAKHTFNPHTATE